MDTDKFSFGIDYFFLILAVVLATVSYKVGDLAWGVAYTIFAALLAGLTYSRHEHAAAQSYEENE